MNHNSLFDQYQPLLYRIACQFGFEPAEINDLVKQVDLFINNIPGSNPYSFKVQVVKAMVQKCIVKISHELFSRNDPAARDHYSNYPGYKDEHSLNTRNMPLTFRSVFILRNVTDFNEAEIAELLNITPLKVKCRFNKAMSLMKDH